MDGARPAPLVPRSVKAAAALLVLVPVWLLLVGVLGAGTFVFPLVAHLALVGLIAAGLVRGSRWAWWLAVGLGLIWLVSCAVPLGGLLTGMIPREALGTVLVLAVVPLGLLAAVLTLLLRPAGRAAFRRRD